jgi:hypothetical protein
MNIKNNKAFVSLIGLLFSIGIIFFIGYKVYDVYLKKPVADRQTQKILSEAGMDTSSQSGAYEGTKAKIRDVNRMLLDREKQLFDANK